jgi:hypothetical protein
MNESPFSPEEQKEFEKIANEEIYKLEAERKREIDELGHPDWLITAFQRLRRLQDSLTRARKSQKTNTEIANEIENILKLYPEALFAYDQKCLAELDQAYQQLLNAALKKSVDEETGDY